MAGTSIPYNTTCDGFTNDVITKRSGQIDLFVNNTIAFTGAYTNFPTVPGACPRQIIGGSGPRQPMVFELDDLSYSIGSVRYLEPSMEEPSCP